MNQKVSIPSRKYNHYLPKNHYTTLNFGQIVPAYCREVAPNTKISIKPNVFARLAPQFLPNLGSITLNLNAYYIPYNYVWQYFNDYKEGTPSHLSSGTFQFKHTPKISNFELSMLFWNDSSLYSEKYEMLTDEDDADYDINEFERRMQNADFFIVGPKSHSNVQGHKKYYCVLSLSKKGKYFYHILQSLGMRYMWAPIQVIDRIPDDDDQNAINNFVYSHELKMDALPLLSFFKVFLDNYVPSQLRPSSPIQNFFAYFNQQNPISLEQGIRYQSLSDMLSYVYNYYQSNYFTSAWLSPNEPVPGLNNFDEVRSTSISTDSPYRYEDGQVVATHSSTSISAYNTENVASGSITVDQLSWLQKFARYIKKNNYVGASVVERILAHYGIRVPDFQVGLSRKLGTLDTPLQKTSVTVTGSDAEAGNIAGQAWFNNRKRKTFKSNCEYHGMIFVLASIQTPSMYSEGVARYLLHDSPFDFFTEEMDGTIKQAISSAEVQSKFNIVDCRNDSMQTLDTMDFKTQSIFGFTNRYQEYKQELDCYSGDFSLEKYSANIDPFVLPRRIFNSIALRSRLVDVKNQNNFDIEGYIYANSREKVTPLSALNADDSFQFNRIFRETDGMADPIFGVFNFEVLINQLALPSSETAELVGKGKAISFESDSHDL